jgi:hypothetical protein
VTPPSVGHEALDHVDRDSENAVPAADLHGAKALLGDPSADRRAAHAERDRRLGDRQEARLGGRRGRHAHLLLTDG